MKQFSAHDIAMMPDWSKLRQAGGVQLEDIAAQTRIPLRKLEALERHEFEQLGDETFAFGYIRSYAKFLREEPEIFLQVYRDALRPKKAAEPFVTQGVAAIGGLQQMWRKTNVLHLALGALALWIVVMLFSGGEPQAPLSEVADERASGEPAPLRMEDMVDQTLSVPGARAAVDDVPAVEETAVEAAGEPTVEASAASPQQALPVGQNGTASGMPPAREVAAAQTTEDLLVFSLSEDCWVEVRDARDRVLIAELKRKGDNLRVFGQAPFKIMLGNARAVTLTINGRAVVTEPPAGRKTLRITVAG